MSSAPERELDDSVARARALVERAGACLLDFQQRSPMRAAEFKGRRELVTAADRASEQIVVDGLRAAFPHHAILAEEGVASPRGRADRAADWLWILDPLDGTTNFVHGLPFYCVALSLSYRDELMLGIVHAPALRDTFTARRGAGARRNDAPIAVSATTDLGHALIATGFSYQRNEPGCDDNSARVARVLPLCRDLRRFGSAQLDLCLTACGAFDAYWEMYLQPYDVAAGGLIVREAGGRVTDLRGGDAWVREGHLLASNGHLHERLLEVVGGAP